MIKCLIPLFQIEQMSFHGKISSVIGVKHGFLDAANFERSRVHGLL